MKKCNGNAEPDKLERVRGHLTRWRKSKRSGGRIPLELWERAVGLCEAQGVSRVSRELGLDYYGLKERAEQSAASRKQTEGFIELSADPGVGCTECHVELDDGGGRRMRLEVRSARGIDVGALGARLWEAAK